MVPNLFYKVILGPYFNDAFVVPHRDVSSSELARFVTTIDDVEQQTGLDLFSLLSDSVERSMESQLWEMWPTSE